MKKKIMGLIAIVAIAAAGYNVYTSQNNVKLSALALANVEALARYEYPDVEITCGSETGQCWRMYGDCYVSWTIRYEDCKFTGYIYDSCVTPCN